MLARLCTLRCRHAAAVCSPGLRDAGALGRLREDRRDGRLAGVAAAAHAAPLRRNRSEGDRSARAAGLLGGALRGTQLQGAAASADGAAAAASRKRRTRLGLSIRHRRLGGSNSRCRAVPQRDPSGRRACRERQRWRELKGRAGTDGPRLGSADGAPRARRSAAANHAPAHRRGRAPARARAVSSQAHAPSGREGGRVLAAACGQRRRRRLLRRLPYAAPHWQRAPGSASRARLAIPSGLAKARTPRRLSAAPWGPWPRCRRQAAQPAEQCALGVTRGLGALRMRAQSCKRARCDLVTHQERRADARSKHVVHRGAR